LLPCPVVGRGGSLLSRWRHRPSRPGRPSRVGAPAVTGLAGTSPDGDPLEVTLVGRRTVLLFLTSSCYGCRPLWAGLGTRPDGGAREQEAEEGARLLLVTPSPSTESARDVAALAHPRRQVLMSSEAWHAFGVTAAPWFVVVDEGVIAAEGAAPPPGDVAALLGPGPG